MVRLGKEAMAYAQKNGPVILDYIRDQHQTNRAVYLRQWLPGLKDEAGRNASNPWEPSSVRRSSGTRPGMTTARPKKG